MATKLPVTSSPYQLFSFSLSEEVAPVSFFVWWNSFDKSWNLSLNDSGNIIFGMKRLVANQWIMPNRVKYNGGDLIVVGDDDPKTLDAFQSGNDLVWFEGLELE